MGYDFIKTASNGSGDPLLYYHPNSDPAIWSAFFIPPDQTQRPDSIPVEQAFYPQSDDYPANGIFVFCAAPGLNVVDLAPAISGALQAVVASDQWKGRRAIAWITNPADIAPQTITLLGIRTTGEFQGVVEVKPNDPPITLAPNGGLALTFDDGAAIALAILNQEEYSFGFSSNSPDNIALTGTAYSTLIPTTKLALTGDGIGLFRFPMNIRRGDLNDGFRWGFQIVYGSANVPQSSWWYPFADRALPGVEDLIGFSISIDPSDITSLRMLGRTSFDFTGTNKDGSATKLISGFRTMQGDVINLIPITQPQSGEQLARFIIAPGIIATGTPSALTLSPCGDFIMTLDTMQSGGSGLLLCGLSGSETMSFTAGPITDPASGDRLRFTPNNNAFAGAYPPSPASPLDPPVDPDTPPLSAGYRTAWVTVMNPPSSSVRTIGYNLQLTGSAMYGFDAAVWSENHGLLGSVTTGYLISTDPVPMMPYGLPVVTQAEADIAQDLEQFAISSARREILSTPSATVAALADNPMQGTTPNGFLAGFDGASGAMTSAILGVNYNATSDGPMWMSFTDPPARLRQALQTPNAFVVVADPTHLGAFAQSPVSSSPPTATGQPTFYNTMAIDEWQIAVNVGSNNSYGDYNNIMIIKGCKGAVADLVKQPDNWTQRQDFSIPGGDSNQIPILSQWLDSYVQDGINQNNPYFDNFRAIVEDPNWTGILVIKASLTALPTNLGGLLAVIDKTQTFAHHFGVTISPISADNQSQKLSIPHSSSIFQLIYYTEPGFVPATNPADNQPLAPSGTSAYDFKLLTLKALFENTSVKTFESLAQLTLGAFFGDAVSNMQDGGNAYNTIFLQGAYQLIGTVGTFMLDSVNDNLFFMNSNVINKVEITKVQYSTIDANNSRFDLWGYLDFKPLSIVPTDGSAGFTFDPFGFGYDDDPEALRKGLSFSGLGITMNTSTSPATFAFDASAIAFNPAPPQSTFRQGSLYQSFALSLKGFLIGDGQNDPTSQNYLNVPTNASLGGVSGSAWYALSFDLKMGTAGDLAGKAGLNSGLIIAWAPGGTKSQTYYKVMIGLQLPGVSSKSKMLSLEGILSLSIGSILLSYDIPKGASKTDRYWMLWLSNIAVKFLGLLKIPPNGATNFVCFGNPDPNATPTSLGWYAVYNQTKS